MYLLCLNFRNFPYLRTTTTPPSTATPTIATNSTIITIRATTPITTPPATEPAIIPEHNHTTTTTIYITITTLSTLSTSTSYTHSNRSVAVAAVVEGEAVEGATTAVKGTVVVGEKMGALLDLRGAQLREQVRIAMC